MFYSLINQMVADRCCDEQMFLTPCCEALVCVFCEDSCRTCFDSIEWSK